MKNKTVVEGLAEFVYDILVEYHTHNLDEHSDRQDIGWTIAKRIYKEYADKNKNVDKKARLT